MNQIPECTQLQRRERPIPYGRQSIGQAEIEAVVKVLQSDWLTTGPDVEAFESEFARSTKSRNAVSVCNGTAALHAAMNAINVGQDDEVIVPAITFAATANAVVYAGARPVFADIDPQTLLVDPESVRARVTSRTRAVVAMDYGGQPCDYRNLRAIADRFGLALIADACHSLGATFQGTPVGSLADLTCFSFHPLKPITTGEGGMITTDSDRSADRMRQFRNHGIVNDFRHRTETVEHRYDIAELGHNYRLTDLQCALGRCQLGRLGEFVEKRNRIAARYDSAMANWHKATPLGRKADRTHGFHLYVVTLSDEVDRDSVFRLLRRQNVQVNVHYLPVFDHTFYRQRFPEPDDSCPNARRTYEKVLTLPIYVDMKETDVDFVVESLRDAIECSCRHH